MSSKTIQKWCDSHGFSREFFYVLKKRNLAPRTFNAGTAVRISDEADAEWMRARESESSAKQPASKVAAETPA
jgi:hypothetical protein